MQESFLIVRDVFYEALLDLCVSDHGVPQRVLHARLDELLIPLGVEGLVVGDVHVAGTGNYSHQQRQCGITARVLQQIADSAHELRREVVT